MITSGAENLLYQFIFSSGLVGCKPYLRFVVAKSMEQELAGASKAHRR
jgi:hypothetical protein